MASSPASFHIAIVGGGIAGLCLGIGLQARSIQFTIYERAAGVSEVGAGIGLSPNAELAMERLHQSVHDAYERVANPNGEDYFQWVDGLTREPIFKLHVGEGCFRGCRRSEFLEELMKCLPAARVKFGRTLQELDEDDEGKVRMVFADGSCETADAVIGTDGIRSRVRALTSPSTAATYSHQYSFRALIPMDTARSRLGEAMSSTRFMYNGPGAHIITYPIADNTILNALAVVRDAEPWPDSQRHTGRASRDDARAAFAGWDPKVREVIELMPQQMDRWAIFDMCDAPVSRYHCRTRVCLAGDAAHAAGPHLGAGAGMGIEDALLLAELLDVVREGGQRHGGQEVDVRVSLEKAFAVYSDLRHERTQWLVRNTRDAVDLFQWRDPGVSKDPERFGEQITWRFHEIWHYDIDKMVADGRRLLRESDNEDAVGPGRAGQVAGLSAIRV